MKTAEEYLARAATAESEAAAYRQQAAYWRDEAVRAARNAHLTLTVLLGFILIGLPAFGLVLLYVVPR